MIAPYADADRSIRRNLLGGAVAASILVVACGGWAATTDIAGAVVASGHVIVEANVKKVQHPFGGVVKEIHVRNGHRVQAGQPLISLDPTVARSNLAVITRTLDALAIRRLRLEAELDRLEELALPPDIAARRDEPTVADLLRAETELFEARSDARAGMRAQLGERIAQFEEQIAGLSLQADAHGQGIALIKEELGGLEGLYSKKVVALNRLMPLKRDEAEMQGQRAQALAEIAQTKGRIAEVRLQILQIDEELRTEVSAALGEVHERAAELQERRVAALDQLQRVEIIAPTEGVVHELGVHTVGGVVEAGATLLIVVPETDHLSIEVKIDIQDRDQVHVGQPAVLRMTAFDARITPELNGTVTLVAADLVEDPRTGQRYYPLRIALSAEEKERLGEKPLSPGMPVEAFVQTGSRSILSYLVKPMSDYAHRAFREI